MRVLGTILPYPCEKRGMAPYKIRLLAQTHLIDVAATKAATFQERPSKENFPDGFIGWFLPGRENKIKIPRKHSTSCSPSGSAY